MTTKTRRMFAVALTAIGVSLSPSILSAEIHGHGPDAWRVTEAEIEALRPRWYLVRSADMSKAGWVAQRYLIAGGCEPVETPGINTDEVPGDAMIRETQEFVRALYESARLARMGGPDPIDPGRRAVAYFSRPRMSASPWARVPMWHWRRPTRRSCAVA